MSISVKSCELRKRIVLFASLLMILAFVLLCIIPRIAYGSATDYTVFYIEQITKLLCGQQVKDCADIMLGRNSGFYDAVIGENGVGTSIAKALKGIGIMLAFAYCMSALIQELLRGRGDLQMWTKFFLKVAVTFTVIIFSDDIIDGIQKLGLGMFEMIEETLINFDFTTELSESPEKILDSQALKDGLEEISKNLWGIATVSSKIGIIWIGFAFLDIIVKVTSYSLFMEFAIRRAFMPIALANITSIGMRSPGVNYLKKYLGMYIKMFVVLITITIAWHIALSSIVAEYGNDIGKMFSDTLVGSGASVAAGTGTALFDVMCIIGAAKAVMNQGARYTDDILGMVGQR